MLVVLSKDALKQYQHLPKSEQVKIKKRLHVLEQDPHSGKKLTGELQGIFSLKVWPYRILYEINKIKKRIEVHKIAHRQSAYK